MATVVESAGSHHGEATPLLSPLPIPTKDARTYALEGLREYLAGLVFRREGGKAFSIPIEQIFIEQPDDPTRMKFPSIGILSADTPFDTATLGGAELYEYTEGLFAPSTALLRRGEIVEDITLEVWEDSYAGRRAIRAVLPLALAPDEESSCLRLRLPDYFNVVADFSQTSSRIVDDQDSVRGRRRSLFVINMRVPDLQLVNVSTLLPYVSVELDPDE